MPSQNYAIMFDALEGGVVVPIKWSKEHLKPDRIVIVIDEENQLIWMWSGKQNGIVKRRTALRQAESLKGHGHTIGKAIIGRGIRKIIEIDDRKVGRVEEDTQNFEKFEKLLDTPVREVGDNIVIFATGGEAAPSAAPAIKPSPKPQTVKVDEKEAKPKPAAKPKLETPKIEVKPKPKPAAKPKLETPKIEVKPKPKPAAKSTTAGSGGGEVPAALKAELMKGLAILAVLSEFSDIYVSKKPSDVISLESLDGDICAFKIKDGEVVFLDGSFKNIPAEKKEAVMGALEMLSGALD
ncbi:MAG: hypothetical protein ACTSU5_04115 [Promethearchaeota archaeon]